MTTEINTASEAYNTGFEAAKQGEPKSACPYAAGTWDADNWLAGWDDAQQSESAGIKVILWHGTTQEEHFVSNYEEAMAIVDERHSNAYGPSFYDAATGEQLDDFGHGLCTKDGKQVH